jgi:hypothetical protein
MGVRARVVSVTGTWAAAGSPNPVFSNSCKPRHEPSHRRPICGGVVEHYPEGQDFRRPAGRAPLGDPADPDGQRVDGQREAPGQHADAAIPVAVTTTVPMVRLIRAGLRISQCR